MPLISSGLYGRIKSSVKIRKRERHQRVNRYKCDICRTAITTIDRDKGNTPLFMPCHPKCGEYTMRNMFYKVDQDLIPDYEWFIPESFESESQANQEYVAGGGMLLRRLTYEEKKEYGY